MEKSRIAIITTVVNPQLYQMTASHFPKGIQKYVIDGSNGMHGIHSLFFMFRKLPKESIDWLILADEDVIFKNTEKVFAIIKKMEDEKHTVCGVRDGGVINHRNYNPHMVNTFFTILNFKEIEEIWNLNEIKKQQYIFGNEFTISSDVSGNFDITSLFEPYYCFFLWLKRLGKSFLYLEANMLNDGISNSVLYEGEEFLFHTWYARSYGLNKKHTDRINEVFRFLSVDNSVKNDMIEAVYFKDSLYCLKKKINKFYQRMILKLIKQRN